jgi:hypothetical protein
MVYPINMYNKLTPKKSIPSFIRIYLLVFFLLQIHFPTLVAQSVVRYSTLADTKSIHNANIGDLIISGATEVANASPAIYIHLNENWKINPGNKILIKGGIYEWVAIYNNSSGTADQPIVITNYDGQVETKELIIAGLSHFKLTGKYDSVNQTGDYKFKGHNSAYAYSQGKYGIFINNQWTSTNRFLLSINGVTDDNNVHFPCTNYELEFIESGNGGYSNVLKWDNQQGIVENVKIHDCYFHDTGGEGIYLGNTDWGKPQQVFRNLSFYNNRLLRCGLDGLQLNRIGENAKIFNNVIDGGMNWKAPFMEWQDFGASLSFVNGGSFFMNNIILNGSGAFFQSHFRPEPWYSKTRIIQGDIQFENNLCLTTKSGVGVYLGPAQESLEDVNVIINKNDFNKWKYRYNEVFPKLTDQQAIIFSFYNGKVSVANNRWDSSERKSKIYQSSDKNILFNDNNKITPIDVVEFENYFGNGYCNVFLEMWAGMISVGEKNKSFVRYFPGQFVSHKSKIYKCIRENENVMPGSHVDWQIFWELQLFDGGKYSYPPDDVRIKKNNYHAFMERGIIL